MYNVSIPKISQEVLLELYSRIKPIVTIDGKKYWLREFTLKELTDISYIFKMHEDKRQLVDLDLIVVRENKDFECIHEYGYHGLFKPSIAEVLAQIDPLDTEFYDAFEIINSPKTVSDFNKNINVFNQGFHISTVRLYTSRSNPNVKFLK